MCCPPGLPGVCLSPELADSTPPVHRRVKRPRKVLPSREEVCQRGAARTVCHAILTQIVSAPGSLAPAPKMSNKKLEEKYERASKPPPSPPSAQRHPDPPSTNTSPLSTAHPPPTPPAPDLRTAIKHQNANSISGPDPDPERTGTTKSSRITSGSQRTAAALTATAAATSTSSSTSTPSSAPHARAW